MDKIDFSKKTSNDLKPSVEFDAAEYMHHLEGMDLTDDEAKEVLSTLWDMMIQFVDLGFKVKTSAPRHQTTDENSSVIKPDSKTATRCEENRP